MEAQKTVADLIKEKMQVDLPVDQVWELTKKLANDQPDLYIDLNAIDDAIAGLIATELDKSCAGLAVGNSGGQLATNEGNKGKKNKKKSDSTSDASDPIERLIPVIKELHTTVSTQTGAMKNIVRKKVEEKKNSAVEELLALTDGINEEILLDFTKGLEARSSETKSFLERFEGAFDEAWGN